MRHPWRRAIVCLMLSALLLGAGGTITVELTTEQAARMQAIAARHQLSVDQLFRQWALGLITEDQAAETRQRLDTITRALREADPATWRRIENVLGLRGPRRPTKGDQE